MHKLLNRLGYIVEKEKLLENDVKQIRDELTMTPFVIPTMRDIQVAKSFNICMETSKYFLLPRFYGLRKFGKPNKIDYKITSESYVDVNVTANILPHQVDAYTNSVNAFKRCGGGILCLPCGYGKTVLGIILALRVLKLKTLIIVHKEFLKLQWIERIEMFSNARIGIIQANKTDVKDKDIVIGMLQSISMKDYPRELFQDFGLAIIDEVHHIGAEVFSRALNKISTKYMLGLSATPNRPDGLDKVFKYYMGEIFHKELRKGVNTVYVKKLVVNSNLVEYDEVRRKMRGKDMVDTITMHTQISRCRDRNRLIIHILEQLYTHQQRKILVLSMRIEQLLYIKRTLEQMRIKSHTTGKLMTFGLYIGKPSEMNKHSYRQMLKDSEKCDIVLATVHYASEALDIPDLNALLLCSSVSSESMIEQSCGRILRKFHKDKYPIIIDLVDQSGNFSKHFSIRHRFYKQEDYKIMQYNMVLEEIVLHERFDEVLVSQLDEFLISTDIKKYAIKRQSKSKKEKTTNDAPIECVL